MRKVIILAFAIVLVVVTHNHYTEKEKKQETKNNIPHVSTRIEQEETPKEEKENTSDEETISYISNIKNEVETISDKETITSEEKNKIKEKFIILTDFIFYNGEINGTTFDELTTSTKAKIISIYEEIDVIIESKIPGYKEKLDKTYNDIKEDLKILKDKIKEEYKDEVGEENYKEQQQIFEESIDTLEESIEPTIDTITEKTIEAYEKTKSELDNWYQNWKEDVVQ